MGFLGVRKQLERYQQSIQIILYIYKISDTCPISLRVSVSGKYWRSIGTWYVMVHKVHCSIWMHGQDHGLKLLFIKQISSLNKHQH